MGFPDLTIKDMVRAQKLLLDHLKVNPYILLLVEVWEECRPSVDIEFPSFVQRAMIIAATPQHSAQTIAFNEVGRTSIKGDPRWNNGDYTQISPRDGLGVARMMAHITYLSDEGMEQKFGRNQMSVTNSGNKALDEEDKQFTVESYLHYQGNKFVGRFDANTYLKLTKHSIILILVGEKGLDDSLQNVRSKVMVVGFTSDWLYTPAQNKMIAESLQRLNKNASYLEIDHEHGHDSFLIKSEKFLRLIRLFLNGGDQNEIDTFE